MNEVLCMVSYIADGTLYITVPSHTHSPLIVKGLNHMCGSLEFSSFFKIKSSEANTHVDAFNASTEQDSLPPSKTVTKCSVILQTE